VFLAGAFFGINWAKKQICFLIKILEFLCDLNLCQKTGIFAVLNKFFTHLNIKPLKLAQIYCI